MATLRVSSAALIFLVALIFPTVVLGAGGNVDPSKAILFFMPSGNAFENPFITAAEKGIYAASKAFPEVPIARIYPYSVDTIHEYIRFAASRGHRIIVGVGAYYAPAFEKIAGDFPDHHFILIDAEVTLPNVKSVVFDNFEAGYMAGLVAGLGSENRRVGFIGACPIDLIRDFRKGYKAGVAAISPDTIVHTRFISSGFDGFSMADEASKIADELYRRGCDVLFSAAGASGLGVIDSARFNRKYVIGVDADQDGLAKGFVLTSVMKRVDSAVTNIIQAVSEGKLERGRLVYNLGNMGLTLTDFRFSENRMGRESIRKIRDLLFDLRLKYKDSLASEIRSHRD